MQRPLYGDFKTQGIQRSWRPAGGGGISMINLENEDTWHIVSSLKNVSPYLGDTLPCGGFLSSLFVLRFHVAPNIESVITKTCSPLLTTSGYWLSIGRLCASGQLSASKEVHQLPSGPPALIALTLSSWVLTSMLRVQVFPVCQ